MTLNSVQRIILKIGEHNLSQALTAKNLREERKARENLKQGIERRGGGGAVRSHSLRAAHLCKVFSIYLESPSTLSTLTLRHSSIVPKEPALLLSGRISCPTSVIPSCSVCLPQSACHTPFCKSLFTYLSAPQSCC